MVTTSKELKISRLWNFLWKRKLAKFAQKLEILNNTFKPALVQKISRIKVYNAPALTFLLYGSENRTRKKKDEKRLTSIEIKFFRRTAAPVHPVSEEQQQRYTLFQKNSSSGTPCFRRTAAAVHPVWPRKEWRNFGRAEGVGPFDETLRKYKSNCLRHVTRFNKSRMP